MYYIPRDLIDGGFSTSQIDLLECHSSMFLGTKENKKNTRLKPRLNQIEGLPSRELEEWWLLQTCLPLCCHSLVALYHKRYAMLFVRFLKFWIYQYRFVIHFFVLHFYFLWFSDFVQDDN